jgi:hypothetical protein
MAHVQVLIRHSPKGTDLRMPQNEFGYTETQQSINMYEPVSHLSKHLWAYRPNI